MIAAYRSAAGWLRGEVVGEVLTPLRGGRRCCGTAVTDQTSIMCYQVDGDLTFDGAPILGGGDINELDHRFAALVYPGPSVT